MLLICQHFPFGNALVPLPLRRGGFHIRPRRLAYTSPLPFTKQTKSAGITNHRNDESLFPRRVFQLPREKRASPGVLSIFCLPKTILSDWAGVCNLYFRFCQVVPHFYTIFSKHKTVDIPPQSCRNRPLKVSTVETISVPGS